MNIGGAVFSKTSKDIVAENVFGASTAPLTPILRLEELMQSPLAKFPLFQSSINSCVVCSLTFINMWMSWKAGTFEPLSWPFPYSQAPHYAGGTKPQEVFGIGKNVGQCKDSLMPQAKYWNEPFWLDSKDAPSAEAFADAENYKTGPYIFINDTSPQGIQPYLLEQPVAIGIWVDPSTWVQQEAGICRPGEKMYAHFVVQISRKEDGTRVCVSWSEKGRLDIRLLSPDYPVVMALAVKDLPDGVMQNKYFRRGTFLSRIGRSFLNLL